MPTGLPLHKTSEIYQRLGERIRQSRLAARLSQIQLASLTGLGHDGVSKIKLGRSRVEVMVIVELAEILNTDVKFLLKE